MNTQTIVDIGEYSNKVLDYLEYLNYPDMVLDFEPLDVAISNGSCIAMNYRLGISYRMCALIIFSLTMECQVIPYANSLAKQ